MSYHDDCRKAAESFSRFLRELEAQGLKFYESDAALAAVLAEHVPATSDFEATFDMIAAGFRVKEAA